MIMKLGDAIVSAFDTMEVTQETVSKRLGVTMQCFNNRLTTNMSVEKLLEILNASDCRLVIYSPNCDGSIMIDGVGREGKPIRR